MSGSDYRTSLPKISEVGRLKSIDHQQRQHQLAAENSSFQKLIDKKGKETQRASKSEQEKIGNKNRRQKNNGKRQRQSDRQRKKKQGLDIKV